MNNPSCIDLVIASRPNSIQNMSTFCTKLFDFHRLSEKQHLKNFSTEIVINLMLIILKLNCSKI